MSIWPFSWESAMREAKRSHGAMVIRKRWYGWVVVAAPTQEEEK